MHEGNRVHGCQSIMYLHTTLIDGKLTFYAHSDALISRGLAAILLEHYNGKTPKDLLLSEPTFLQEEGIISSLSPTRANGVASLWLKMKQAAVVLVAKTQAPTSDAHSHKEDVASQVQ